MASCKRNFLNVNHGKLGRLKVNLIICKLQCHLTNSFQLGSHSPSYFLQHKLCIVSSKTFGCWVFTNGMTFSNELILRQAGLKLVRPWACSRPKGGIIQSAIDRWSDCIGQDRDSSRPPDLKSSSNVSLPFALITRPATDPNFNLSLYATPPI